MDTSNLRSDSILQSIKQMIGGSMTDDCYDADLIIHINSALTILSQEGVGPPGGFAIRGPNETWEDFIGNDPRFESVKTLVYLRVKVVFDPPLTSSVLQAMQDIIKELEWRLYVEADNGGY